MKTKRRIVTSLALVALATLASFGIFWGTQRAHAQDQLPPPVNDRISFGMVGITPGQTIRLNVVNVQPSPSDGFPPAPSRVVLTFLNSDGQLFRGRDGNPVRRVAMLEPGASTFLNLNADQFAGDAARLQLRALVTLQPPPIGEQAPPQPERIVATVEGVNNASGRTDWVLSGEHFRGVQPSPIPD